jgi:hypothetical protein
VNLVPAQPVGRAEQADLGLDFALQRLEPAELVSLPGQPLEVCDDQRTYRGVTPCGSDPGISVDIIGNRVRFLTVSQ